MCLSHILWPTILWVTMAGTISKLTRLITSISSLLVSTCNTYMYRYVQPLSLSIFPLIQGSDCPFAIVAICNRKSTSYTEKAFLYIIFCAQDLQAVTGYIFLSSYILHSFLHFRWLFHNSKCGTAVWFFLAPWIKNQSISNCHAVRESSWTTLLRRENLKQYHLLPLLLVE